MRTLTNEQIIYILENVCKPVEFTPDDCDNEEVKGQEEICENCPLKDDCLYYFWGSDGEGTVLTEEE